MNIIKTSENPKSYVVLEKKSTFLPKDLSLSKFKIRNLEISSFENILSVSKLPHFV